MKEENDKEEETGNNTLFNKGYCGAEKVQPIKASNNTSFNILTTKLCERKKKTRGKTTQEVNCLIERKCVTLCVKENEK